MLKKNILCVLSVVMLFSITPFAFAEDAAPVYDADNYPPQFDGQSDAGLIPDSASVAPNPQPLASQPVTAQNNVSNVYNPPAQSMSLNQRVARMEQQLGFLEHKDLPSKIDALQNDIQNLRGQVEDLTHQVQVAQKNPGSSKNDTLKSDLQTMRAQLDQLTEKLQDLQVSSHVTTKISSKNESMDLADNADEDLSNTSQTKTVVIKSKLKSADAGIPTLNAKQKSRVASQPSLEAQSTLKNQQPNVAEEQQIYQTAYDLIKAKKYNDAIAALQKMLHKYPTGQFAANAHYWLGELYGLLSKNDQAAVEFDTVVTQFPDSPKVADAQLKLGLIYAAQFKWVDAKGAFKKVISHYPGTASARLASEQLKQIKATGH